MVSGGGGGEALQQQQVEGEGVLFGMNAPHWPDDPTWLRGGEGTGREQQGKYKQPGLAVFSLLCVGEMKAGRGGMTRW